MFANFRRISSFVLVHSGFTVTLSSHTKFTISLNLLCGNLFHTEFYLLYNERRKHMKNGYEKRCVSNCWLTAFVSSYLLLQIIFKKNSKKWNYWTGTQLLLPKLQPDGETLFTAGVTEGIKCIYSLTHPLTALPSVLGLHQPAATTCSLEWEGFH